MKVNEQNKKDIAAICNVFEEIVDMESYSNGTLKLPRVTWGVELGV